MKLSTLIDDLKTRRKVMEIIGSVDKKIKKIVYDSRQAEPGSLFVCIEGFKNDGHDYIDDALSRGAVAVVVEKELSDYCQELTYIQVADSREALSLVAACFYDYPHQDVKLIGVTGTNGKTTTTYLLKGIFEEAGYNCGLMGTINIKIGNEEFAADRTTPESLDIFRYLHMMKQENIDFVFMEVSSHALQLKRVAGMEFDGAIFTNISQDHLDFHSSLDDYAAIKSQLFQQLMPQGKAAINRDDSFAGMMEKACNGEYYTFALENNADYRAENITLKARGSSFVIKRNNQKAMELKCRLNISGLFNVYNAMGAAVCAFAFNISGDKIVSGLEKIEGIPGRFELVNLGQDFNVVVDYAHTPDGMENVLSTASSLIEGRLLIVFGCGGDRDREKRPLMGQIGVQYGDVCFITSDNPRSESPLQIMEDIISGIEDEEINLSEELSSEGRWERVDDNKNIDYKVIPDRRQAIIEAIRQANSGDMVMIIGKGHETYQIFDDRVIDFDDRQVSREALNSLMAGE